MNGISTMKNLLYDELGLIVRTTAGLLRKIRPEDWSYQPAASMRTLQELAEHLALVPGADLLILKEQPETIVRDYEALYDKAGTEQLITAMEQGKRDLITYMDGLTDEQFLTRKTTPFYLEHGTTQAQWLIEIVTHAQHHRAQLFTYLKLLGYEVNMFDLY